MNCNSGNQFFCCRCCDSRCWKLFWCNDWSWCRSPPPPHFCCCSRPLLECSARPVSFPLHLHLSSRWCRRITTTWEIKIQQQQKQYLDCKERAMKMITTAKTTTPFIDIESPRLDEFHFDRVHESWQRSSSSSSTLSSSTFSVANILANTETPIHDHSHVMRFACRQTATWIFWTQTSFCLSGLQCFCPILALPFKH